MSDMVSQRLDDLGDSLQSVIGALRIMLEGQKAHGEMLRQILAAVTEAPPENSPLEQLLLDLIGADESHGRKLDAVLEIMTQQPIR